MKSNLTTKNLTKILGFKATQTPSELVRHFKKCREQNRFTSKLFAVIDNDEHTIEFEHVFDVYNSTASDNSYPLITSSWLQEWFDEQRITQSDIAEFLIVNEDELFEDFCEQRNGEDN